MNTLHITGMTCGHCVKHVEQALRQVPGVTAVAVDLASGTARVEGAADPAALVAAVEAEDYTATVQD